MTRVWAEDMEVFRSQAVSDVGVARGDLVHKRNAESRFETGLAELCCLAETRDSLPRGFWVASFRRA